MFQISLAHFLTKPQLNLSMVEYEIIFDLSKESFLKEIVFFYEHLLYPLYYHHKKVVITNFPFSRQTISISPLLLHTNREAIDIHLYLEAWCFLERESSSLKKDSHLVLDRLNFEQKKAVQTLWGPVCLLAPAGSGKTKTLVNRIDSLFHHGVKPENILILVFNKKAEIELKSRFSQNSVEIRTFHSFGYQLLKQYTEFEFYQEDPVELENTLLEQVVSRHHSLSYGKNQDPLKVYREKLSQVKNELLSMDEMRMEFSHQTIDFYPIFQDYLRLLEEEKLYDYDDMLYLSLCLLLKDGALRRRIQTKYQFLLVDEFQDLNSLQLLFLKVIALPQNHLFVVGDDDQMIYGFRGASVRPILDFKKTYCSATCLQLSTNYRSSQRIVYHARLFIEHNLERVSKQIRPYSKTLGEVNIRVGTSFQEEVVALFHWVLTVPASFTIAILYRYQIYGYFLKIFLAIRGCTTLPDSFAGTFQRFFLLLQFFLEPFSLTTAKKVASFFSISLSPFVSSLEEVLAVFDHYAFFSKIMFLLSKRDLSFRSFCLFLKVDISFFFSEEEISDEKLLSFFDSFISYFGGVKGFYEAWKTRSSSKARSIVFATIHKTKGNEFDAVGYFHMEYPLQKDYLEEERRISYVAMTRAKSMLFITTDSYQFPRFSKEYLQNNTFEGIVTSSLKEKQEDLEEELKEKQALFLLRKKDHSFVQQRLHYEIQEETKAYYKKQRDSLTVLKHQTDLLEQELFMYQEELWGRGLSSKHPCGIIGLEKRDDENEKII